VATRWLGGEGGSMVSFSMRREGVNDDKLATGIQEE